jgi:4-diphosphocytidyl-2-C-methyl-D-erythritol kinase
VTVIEGAPAKLNLTLQVLGRRADGYHLLDSLVAFTDYGDTVAVTPAEELTLTLDGPFGGVLAGDHTENLVLRAARLLAERAGVAARAAITLTKRLPVASGIGGGSSDAAATLRALMRLWRVEIPAADLEALALRLGADVPVCLTRRSARLEGIGERVTPAPNLPAAPLVLVNPGIGLATPKVFAARRGDFSSGPGPAGVFAVPPTDVPALAEGLRPYANDLTAAAAGLLPEIDACLTMLDRQDGCLLARMSGSGATCFGLFASDAEAAAAAETIAAARPGWWAVATRLAPA